MEDCGSDGCSTLYFNEYHGADGACTSSDRCVCKTTGKQFLLPGIAFLQVLEGHFLLVEFDL